VLAGQSSGGWPPVPLRSTDVVHEKRIEIRWRDLDAFGHVNHVVFLTYLEEVRDEWLALTLGDPALVWGFVIAHVEVDYRKELTQEDDVIVAHCALDRVGTSSVSTTESITTTGGELVAEAKAVLVARDEESGRSRPLSDIERAAFTSRP
jgi:acyl-CoA thioester hydrolase